MAGSLNAGKGNLKINSMKIAKTGKKKPNVPMAILVLFFVIIFCHQVGQGLRSPIPL